MSEEQLNLLMNFIDCRIAEAINVSFQRPRDDDLIRTIDATRAALYHSFGYKWTTP